MYHSIYQSHAGNNYRVNMFFISKQICVCTNLCITNGLRNHVDK